MKNNSKFLNAALSSIIIILFTFIIGSNYSSAPYCYGEVSVEENDMEDDSFVYTVTDDMGDIFPTGKQMRKGQYLQRGEYRLTFEKSGNLVLYKNNKPEWSLQNFGIAENAAARVMLQSSGNFCVLDASGTTILESKTTYANKDLELLADGRITIGGNHIDKLYSLGKEYVISNLSGVKAEEEKPAPGTENGEGGENTNSVGGAPLEGGTTVNGDPGEPMINNIFSNFVNSIVRFILSFFQRMMSFFF